MQSLIDTLGALNWWAVIVAALAGFFVGFMWYSKPVLGKQWMKAVGLTEKDLKNASMFGPIVTTLLTVVVTAIALAVLLHVLALGSAWQGATFGVLIVLGFISTNKLMQALFEQRPLQLFWINFGGDVISLAVMGAILAVWR